MAAAAERALRRRVVAEFVRYCCCCCDDDAGASAGVSCAGAEAVPAAAPPASAAAVRSERGGDIGPWECCGKRVATLAEIHRHLATAHGHCVDAAAAAAASDAADAARRAGRPRLSAAVAKEGRGGGVSVAWRVARRAAPCPCCGWPAEVTAEVDAAGNDSGNGGDGAHGAVEGPAIDPLGPPQCAHNDGPLPRVLEVAPAAGGAHGGNGSGIVLLFYHYCDVADPAAVAARVRSACEGLCLVGKVRVASEGINGCLSGSRSAAARLVGAVVSLRPFAARLRPQDFLWSAGPERAFAGLEVVVVDEIITLGVPAAVVPAAAAAERLAPAEFHAAASATAANPGGDTVLLDVRNMYEWRIGRFEGAVCPDLRKFSYFPDYLERNTDMFRGKRVLMYCTGGVRCERASAFLAGLGVARSVHQLHGGVHRYLEAFPHGLFRGKLYVFDGRGAVATNDDVVGSCFYCARPHDTYAHCTTQRCRVLVLSCDACRASGHTACCDDCRASESLQGAGGGEEAAAGRAQKRVPCRCVRLRSRCPVEQAPAGLTARALAAM